MGKETNIEWCDSTINPSSGCDGCELWSQTRRTCYAGTLQTRRLSLSLPKLYARDFREVRMIPGRMAKAAAWADLRGEARPNKPWLDGMPRTIFVGDMGDFLSRKVADEFIKREVLDTIISKQGRRHFYMLLTKRPKRLARLSQKWGGLPDNVMAMTTVTDQRTADARVPALMEVLCQWRGISAEPLYGPLDLTRWLDPSGIRCMDVCTDKSYVDVSKVETWTDGDERGPRCPDCGAAASWTGWDPGIDWVICGGESGANAQALLPKHPMALQAQCEAAGVPFFFKQWGEWVPARECSIDHPSMGKPPVVIGGVNFVRAGKQAGERHLDGRLWNGMPALGGAA